MERKAVYISTIAPDAPDIARAFGFGLEIAEYCTAYNMDERFGETHAAVSGKISGVERLTFHAPFNELFPCAIDPRARKLAMERYKQALELSVSYGARRMVIHGGFNPSMYFPVWYTEQSVPFWKEFLEDVPGDMLICLENVTEPEPDMLMDIIAGVSDDRLRICLDIGHANAYSKRTPLEWLRSCAPAIAHFHVHNNHGDFDAHNALFDGSIPMPELLCAIDSLCPTATVALEVLEARPSAEWLLERL